MPVLPPLSIGVPVFNGVATIGKAIESLLSQSHPNLEIIVSDNDSTDGTHEVCQRLSMHDSRVRFVRQPLNIGADANFGFVLDAAKYNYFMWAAADDTWDCEFVARNLRFLEENGDHVASISRVAFRPGMNDEDIGATSLDSPSELARVRRFLSNPGANSRYYSIARIKPLRDAYRVPGRFLARDWAIVVALLLHGKMHVLDGEPLMRRGWQGASSDPVGLFRSMGGRGIENVFPLLPFSREVVRLMGPSPGVLLDLARLNLLVMRNYLRARVRQRRGTAG